MSRRYTAQDMRETADGLKDDPGMDALIIADMLRQAADDMEREEKRERKYEYAEKFKEGMVACLHRERPVDHCEMYPGSIAVRREVGEWEEVKDEQD